MHPFVFPAHAGMSQRQSFVKWVWWCFPRTRGDEPHSMTLPIPNCEFSPHTRG